MFTNKEQEKIYALYNKEKNQKRLLYYTLKTYTVKYKQAKISEIMQEIRYMLHEGKIHMTEKEFDKLYDDAKSILFELQKLGFVDSKIYEEIVHHVKKSDGICKYKSRYWWTIK